MNEFVHLHVHTTYSLLDGAARIPDLIAQAKQMGQKALAITDHGVLYGVVDFYKAAKAAGIHPILGCEVYTAARRMQDKSHDRDRHCGHLVLLAETYEGYQNLMHLVSIAQLEGFYYKPRIDYEQLAQHQKGLIALSGCLAGDIPQALLQGDIKRAQAITERLISIFGKDHFFIELQNQGLPEQLRINPQLMELARKNGLQTVATNDVHYTNRQDASVQDVLLCVQTNTTIQERNRLRLETEEYYLKSAEEMEQALPEYTQALQNTAILAQRCQVELPFGQLHLPHYPTPEGKDPYAYLSKLCQQGIQQKYGGETDEIRTRLAYELDVIRSMGYVDYFLIVWDFVKFAKDHGIHVGPGRGSAAGSIVSYLLNITTVDPLRYALLFERFLNPERVSMPDIDIDFCYVRRNEVIDYVTQKYGNDFVARIITFDTLAARGAIRDVGRALGLPYQTVDRVAKLVPSTLKITLKEALEQSAPLRAIYEQDEAVHRLIEMAQAVEGMPRHASIHAAGVLICGEPTHHLVPLQAQQDRVVTQFPMGTLEELGLLKMDFLGLRTLTVIHDAVSFIRQTKGISVDMETIDFEDPAVFRLLSGGHTDGLFQLESQGMKQFLRELRPDCLEDMIAGISLYRPGPMASIPTYIHNKTHPQAVTYKHELLRPILHTTYGCIVYQEQVMQIVQKMAGYTLGHADMVRRAMSKKKADVMEQERKLFLDGAKEKGVSGEISGAVFDEIAEFANYAFNKSHAACYAVIAYQTAWLKTHYPTEFLAALLTSVLGNMPKVSAYVAECERLGLRLLPPDINESIDVFSCGERSIRFGLAAVKNVGRQATQQIVEERKQNGPFLSLRDFLERMKSDCNRRLIESLIRCGAFDGLEGNRAQKLAVLDSWMEEIASSQRHAVAGQLSLFAPQDEEPALVYPDIEEFSSRERLAMELEMTGLYLTGHPLEEYRATIEQVSATPISALWNKEVEETASLTLAGLLVQCKKKTTKQKAEMAILQLMDFTGTIEVLVFPKVYREFQNQLEEHTPISLQGTVRFSEEDPPTFIPDRICRLQKMDVLDVKQLSIRLSTSQKNAVIRELANYAGGKTAVYLYHTETKQWSIAKQEKWVHCTPALLQRLEALVGKEQITITQ